jgi:hypothetical protein
MIDDDTKMRFVLSGFRDIESLLADCLSFIPFIDCNKQVISPKFIPLITESCGFIESIFNEIASMEYKKYGLKDYAHDLESRLNIDRAITVFLNPPILFLRPFHSWTNKQPLWWKAYNKLKHDRLNNYEAATYDNAIMALAGLHQVISRTIDFVPSLIADGWFNSNSPDIGELIAARISEAGVPIQIIPVESIFFVSPLHDNFVTFENGIPNIIECDFTNRVKEMLTVYEWFKSTT